MRARGISPGYFVCPELLALPMETRLLFAGLWCCADREGRLQDRPAKIKLQVLPSDDVDVDALLGQLADSGFIQRYEVEGERVIQVVNFGKYQRPHHKEKLSGLPTPDTNLGKCKHQPRQVQARSDSLIPETLITDTLIADTRIERQAADTPQDVGKIFDYWQSRDNLITHRRLTDDMKTHAGARLRDYSLEEITQAVDNYSTILASRDHALDHKWTLAEFMTRGFEKFLTVNDPFTSYKKSNRKREESTGGRPGFYGKS